jgi:hypothetical protein
MSVIDLLTDENYAAILRAKELEIAALQSRIVWLDSEVIRLQKVSDVKTKRIISLKEEVDLLARQLEAF